MLERNRVARRVYSYYFTLKDCFVCFDVAFDSFDDFWQALCHVCESSAENPHCVSELVDLHSCTIILVLESRFATMNFQGFIHAGSHLSQHELHWSEHSETELR